MNKYTKRNTSSTNFEIALSQLDGRYFEKDGWPVKADSEFEEVITDFGNLVMDKEMRNLRNDIRAKIRSFVNNGDVQYGMSNVDIMGSYLTGDKPKKPNDLNKRTARLQGQTYYAKSLAQGFDNLLKEKKFVFHEDNNYDTPEQALLALEMDSAASKGPYDNGSADQALKTVNANLKGVLMHKRWDKDLIPVISEYFDKRTVQIKGHVDTEFQLVAQEYVEYLQSRGLKSTMRGWPFYAAGDSKVRKHHYETSLWMFEGIKIDFPSLELAMEMTIDEFIQDILMKLREAGIKSTTWLNLRHLFIIPISRNQGSGFKTSYKDEEFAITGERKDLKYRLVTPMTAFAQAYCMMGMRNFVTNIVSTRGRIGLETPAINDARSNDFLRLAQALSQVIHSTDYTAFDSTVTGQELAFSCALGIDIYEDEWVKDSFVAAATSLVHKIMILPSMITDEEHIYEQFSKRELDYIKGDKYYAAKQNLTNMDLREDAIPDEFDYRARAFYIWSGYLPSGHYYTNSGGSEVTLLSGKIYAKWWMYKHGYITREEYETEVLAIASGDDMLQGIPLRLYKAIGYQGVLDLLERAYADFGKIVKASKQIHILMNEFPIVDFLQKVRFQFIGEEYQPEYSKFMRQWPALPYSERYSNLPYLGQYVIVLGKMESGLCRSNIDNAARVMVDTLHGAHSLAVKDGYRTPISPVIKALADEQVWHVNYAIENSPWGGLEPLLGLVKEYGQNLLSELGKYLAETGNVDTLIKNFDTELETRAPHRAVLARAMYRALGVKFVEQAGGAITGTEISTETHFYAIDMLQKMMEISKESVKPMVLDKQKQVGIPDVVAGSDDEYDNPDDYEL